MTIQTAVLIETLVEALALMCVGPVATSTRLRIMLPPLSPLRAFRFLAFKGETLKSTGDIPRRH
ncbi:MAG: hypothetical protein R2864_13380 [Syntrophotaleaceae bacterium]